MQRKPRHLISQYIFRRLKETSFTSYIRVLYQRKKKFTSLKGTHILLLKIKTYILISKFSRIMLDVHLKFSLCGVEGIAH